MYYIFLEGGGTKLIGILFDENCRIISTARSGGIRTQIYSEAQIRSHITECYETLLSSLVHPMHIERIYYNFIGGEICATLLPDYVTLGESLYITEPATALYAASGESNGFVAISGTGSSICCIRNGELHEFIGGWGSILGDEGSGVWMARQAMKATIKSEQGWGEATVFGEMLRERYGLNILWDYVEYLYSTPSPFRRLGELLPLVSEAAEKGDKLMLDIFRRAGSILAEQTMPIFRRNPDMTRKIALCGGAWKGHKIIAETYTSVLKEQFPDVEVIFPRFEHIMAGPIHLGIERGENKEALFDRLAESYPNFVWKYN